MIIEIKSNIFNNDRNLGDVNFLLSLFSDKNRYDYFCEFGVIKNTTLFDQLLDINKELLERYFNRFINNSSLNFDYTISENTSLNEFDINEAKIFFIQPFQLLLENSLNDGVFVDAITNVFRGKGKKIRRHKENGWLKHSNGGGCTNILNYIKAEKKAFQALPKSNHKYLRCFVLIDSDKRYPAEIKQERVNLFTFLKENDIPYHELTKREMENYLPDEIIEKIKGNDEYIKAYLSLDPIQKDYFDIENGFDDKNINSFDKEIQELFDDLSDENISIFRKNKMNLTSFKTEFPKLFEQATQEQLKNRTKHQSNPNELEYLLIKISKLL